VLKHIKGWSYRQLHRELRASLLYRRFTSLLADSLRVMNRYLQRIAQGCQESELRIVNHARAAKHRVLEIARAARTFTQAGQEQLKQSYKKLIGLTQGVRRQAGAVLTALETGRLVARPGAAFLKVVAAEASLRHYLPLVEKVITQRGRASDLRVVSGSLIPLGVAQRVQRPR
jgi:hypothetical protein